MRTPSSTGHPFKWGGYLEIIAADILYERPVHVLGMDVQPDIKLCFVEKHNANIPILLSYKGGDHYNAITDETHTYLVSRPGVKELVVLSANAMGKILNEKAKFPDLVTNAELNEIIGNKTRCQESKEK